jgi:hypothetical protein
MSRSAKRRDAACAAAPGPRRLRPATVARTLAPLAWCIALALHAQGPARFSQNDFGEVGLLQTPTARMADEGEVAVEYSRTEPYTKFNVAGQPVPWFEGAFRYTIVSNRIAPINIGVTNPGSFIDKSIDVKFRLHQESRWMPAVAIGIRDLAGTGLFSSEYVVANKRFGSFDVSLGLAWGYLGARGNLPNPLGWIDSGFDKRPVVKAGTVTGSFVPSRWFHGPTALIGGIQYQTPWERLVLKAELDGNDYQHEPLDNNQPQRWPVNFGALFHANRYIDVTLGYERGNTVMASLTLHDNLATAQAAPKPLDPPPEPVPLVATAETPIVPPRVEPGQTDWEAVSRILEENAGIKVDRIARRGPELLVYGEQTTYFYGAKGLGRAARILENRLDGSIDWITFVSEDHGLPIVEDSLHRSKFVALLDHKLEMPTFKRSVEQDSTAPMHQEQVLFEKPLKRFEAHVSPGFYYSFGGVNSAVLYQVTGDAYATYHFTHHLWFDGQLSVNLLNNYGNYTYDPPSQLPRVRTDLRQYLETSKVNIPNFQLTWAEQLDTDLYGMAYAGMFESMFGGVGAEVLYRPMGDRWALGADANFVRQRGFSQHFSFRNYQVATGHATLYYDTGWYGLKTAISVGRYLAGDWGTTIDVSRQFGNGVRMGAYGTFTTAGKRYGEGSFDKGIYLSIPFDLFLPWSRHDRATLRYQPLLRDGGAKLNKLYELYDMTDDRDTDVFDQNLDTITH